MKNRLLPFLLALTCFVTVAACGGGGGSNVPKCTPGQSVACVGPGSCQGNQVCAANGTYGACMCGGGTAGTSGSGGRGGSAGTAGATGGSVSAGAGGATGGGGGGGGTTGAGGTGTAGSGGGAGHGGSGGGGASGGGAGAGTGGGAGAGGGGGGGGGGTAGSGGAAGAGGASGATGTGGTGGTGASCDPVAQTGCSTGQRCAWVWTTTTAGHNACLADGTVSLGGACTTGAAGETTGFDNCKKGTSCTAGICETICTAMPDTCPNNYGCVIYSNAPFNIDGMSGVGFCEPTCDPLTQKRDTDGAAACGSPTPASPTKGCFGMPGGKFTCSGILSTTKTSEMAAGSPVFTNSCAPGYEPLLVNMTGGSTAICVALCKPADTSTTSTANAAGMPGSGSTCPDKGAGAPNECRYWWYLEDLTNGLSKYSNTLGFCFDYPHYKYPSTSSGVFDTVDPSCATLSTTAHNFDATDSDALVWGCVAHP
jgi:hypothetical protein